MLLPITVIDRIFDRLTATYGRDFKARYEGVDVDAVKASWAHEMAGFDGHLRLIAWALENLPERSPNVIEFRNLCRRAPAPDVPRLEVVAAGKERVAAELAKLQPALAAPLPSTGKDWANRILARHSAGERINPTSLRFAREALGRNGAQ